ncbi:MAG: 4-hydroxy-3-methylbut-2-enyl diphosphate reductase [Paludibacteraceae bacterium]|nr:4-hydroxy-3-methylbut-2-enyl diphosphate reductase [Paludibacteraceae bacterium]
MKPLVTIDEQSGFCFGVVTAIQKAEEELQRGGRLYCLGDIVHNGKEVERLADMGLVTVNRAQFEQLADAKVLLRAHGEPPSTYQTAQRQRINIIDASCPVVRNLQQKIRRTFEEKPDAQIVIFGKQGHAEVVGLQGQTDNTAIVVTRLADVNLIDFTRDICLFSQTTKSVEEFCELVALIEQRVRQAGKGVNFEWHDTICGQVRNRVRHIRDFAAANDRIVFVGGRNSSNGKVLYEHCREANSDTLFIESADELTAEYIVSCGGKRIGICGATSTPLWLMQQCADKLLNTEC